MAKIRKPATSTGKPANATRSLAWLGSPSLLPGEDAAQYDDLLARMSAVVRPADTIEEIWICDVVDLTWDVFRWRRLKDNLITANCRVGLEQILSISLEWREANELAKDWAVRDPGAIIRVDELLASCGLTMDAAVAATLASKIDHIERIDRMVMTAEVRRNATFREIDRHRAALASAAQRAVQEFEDGEFQVVESTRIKPNQLTQSSSA